MRCKTKKRNVKSSKKRRSKSKKMRGSGLTPTGKRTLPTDGNAAGLTAEVLKYFQELEQSKKESSHSPTSSSKKDDQYNSDLSPEEEAKIKFNEQMKSHLNTRLIIKLRQAIPDMLENRNLQISVKEALASEHLTEDDIKKIIYINATIMDDKTIENFVNASITEIQDKERKSRLGDM